MKKLVGGPLFAVLFLFGCTANDSEEPSGQPENPPQEETSQTTEEPEVIAENLEAPWSIEKIEDTFYITERLGNIVQIEEGEAERQEVELDQEVSTAAEAGFLGFVLAPNFSESNEAYAYYTYEDGDDQFNRVITLHLEDNVWSEEEVLLEGIPSGSVHHGGRLAIGPDDALYATTGDASEPDLAQDLESLGGKIVRMDLDGSIPEDNPFSNSYVYSYGHRNSQGITWDSDGAMYASEHGASANDEINLIESGQNYGWPIIEGEEEQEDLETPLFTSGQETTWAPSGMDTDGEVLYVSALARNAVLEFDLETDEVNEVVSDFGRIRDVLIEEDNLYFISNNTDGRGDPEENDDRLYSMSLSE